MNLVFRFSITQKKLLNYTKKTYGGKMNENLLLYTAIYNGIDRYGEAKCIYV